LSVVAVFFTCLSGSGIAQTQGDATSFEPPTPPITITPEMLQTMARAAANVPAGMPATGAIMLLPHTRPQVPTGWNIFLANNCMWYTDGANQYFIVTGTSGQIFWVANNVNVPAATATSCVNGNYVGFYVVNSSTGQFIQTATYPYK
jgi:hypothetical protein